MRRDFALSLLVALGMAGAVVSVYGGGGGLLSLVLLAVLFGVLVALDWAARAAWRALMKTPPPFGFYSVSAIAVSLLLGAIGVFVVPAFVQLFASFGADLPVPTMILMRYRNLLVIPVIPLLGLLYWLRASPRREKYFGAILVCEMCLVTTYVVALYLPIFKVSEVA